jgi:hypothetical protein
MAVDAPRWSNVQDFWVALNRGDALELACCRGQPRNLCFSFDGFSFIVHNFSGAKCNTNKCLFEKGKGAESIICSVDTFFV